MGHSSLYLNFSAFVSKMLKTSCKITVVTPTFQREKEMVHCILQVRKQQTNFPFRHIVVCDGHNPLTASLCSYYGVACVEIPKENGAGHSLGHLPRDVGCLTSDSLYVCFWDDDNVYYEHALQTLYDTVQGFDMGVCAIKYFAHPNGIMKDMPQIWNGDIIHDDIDTMNLIFRRDLALTEPWTQFKQYNGDYFLAKKLQEKHRATINYNPTVIGIHV